MTNVRLPRKSPVPGPIVGAFIAGGGIRFVARVRGGLGDAVRVQIPGMGMLVSVSDPQLIKQVFTASPDVLVGGEGNPLAELLGARSSFGLDGEEHLRARRVLLPPFHGNRMAAYDAIVVEETLKELHTWPVDEDFPVIDSMMRITLNVILRAVFGAQDQAFEALRELLPPAVKLGSSLAPAPWLRRDLGPGSPWRRFLTMRARYDAIVDDLIATARRDPALDQRQDVLALLLAARYDDGTEMTRDDIADQLISMLTAGHETTAATLAWAVERLRRHPKVLERMVTEAQDGGSELREAAIREVQRQRPVITGAFRRTRESFEMGPYLLPPDVTIYIDGLTTHHDGGIYDDPDRFDPDRFLQRSTDTYAWVPFGGGRRRCVGAAFAQMEMDVVLRTMLRHSTLVPTSEPAEAWRFRGVAFQPSRGGVARLARQPRRSNQPQDASLAIAA